MVVLKILFPVTVLHVLQTNSDYNEDFWYLNCYKIGFVKIEFVSLAMMLWGNKISSLEHVRMMMTIGNKPMTACHVNSDPKSMNSYTDYD